MKAFCTSVVVRADGVENGGCIAAVPMFVEDANGLAMFELKRKVGGNKRDAPHRVDGAGLLIPVTSGKRA